MIVSFFSSWELLWLCGIEMRSWVWMYVCGPAAVSSWDGVNKVRSDGCLCILLAAFSALLFWQQHENIHSHSVANTFHAKPPCKSPCWEGIFGAEEMLLFQKITDEMYNWCQQWPSNRFKDLTALIRIKVAEICHEKRFMWTSVCWGDILPESLTHKMGFNWIPAKVWL